MLVKLDGRNLTLQDVFEISRGARVELGQAAKKAVTRAEKFIAEAVKNDKAKIYGVTTGFGELANRRISPEDTKELQLNLILSHACGTGEPLSEGETRAIMALRINTLARGNSGIRLSTLEHLLAMLNQGVLPVIPSQGSVGASGDLAPLSHMAAAMLGVGRVRFEGKEMDASEGLRKAGLEPVELVAKEGLSLINGTQVMCAILSLVVVEATYCLRVANLASAMSLEASLGTDAAFHPYLHAARPHRGQMIVAREMRKALANSSIIKSHRYCDEVQDAYSFRCIPQVHGAVLDTLEYAKKVLEVEINSATDNPLVFPEKGRVISGGNFHGEPVAFIADFTGIALAELGNISERRIDRLVNPHYSKLPPFLAVESGKNSGLMIPQYVAASLVSENKVLAHPASVDSIPTSGGKEDHVSMGTIAARKARKILENVKTVLAIELLTAAQALDFRRPLKPARLTGWMRNEIRKLSPFIEKDRFLYDDIMKIRNRVFSQDMLERVKTCLEK